MTVKYQTVVNGIGDMVEEIKAENMLILFGKGAPRELADFSLAIDINDIKVTFEVGNQLVLADKHYAITAIGDAVETNLTNLGHITLNFNGASVAELPGTLYVEEKPILPLVVGMKVLITD